MLAARRSLLASPAAAAASRRRSVWWSSVVPARRWVATVSADDNDGADIATRLTEATDKKRATLGQKNAREFALLPKLLQTFEGATGHLIVPFHFFVPHADASIVTIADRKPTRVFGRAGDVHQIPWLDDARGVNFGRVLHKFANNPKHNETHPQVANALREMGLPLGETYSKLAWDEQIMAALKTFYQMHKHTLVPIQFEVPRGDARWPVATWGYNLGRRVDTLRKNRHRLSDSEMTDLESVEFSFNAWETVWSDQVLPSLETYAQVHGNCRIPQAFEVPHEDPWPRKARGLKLGQAVSDIRSNSAYAFQVQRDMARLEAIRFVWDDSEYEWSEKVLPSLEVFYQVYGHSVVPTSFDVPSESPWPTEAWGMKLGVSVNSIRSHRTFWQKVERDAARLNAIGFVWSVREHKWTQEILPSLETFFQVHGHTRVPTTFVVPSETPWPEKAWGLQLGPTVWRVVRNQAYAEFTDRDADRLAVIGFRIERRAQCEASGRGAGRDMADGDTST